MFEKQETNSWRLYKLYKFIKYKAYKYHIPCSSHTMLYSSLFSFVLSQTFKKIVKLGNPSEKKFDQFLLCLQNKEKVFVPS